MANVLDVAAYILRKNGVMTAMKLQKLAYYSQAWSLVWDEKPLFRNHIEAWADGPVAPTLYKAHRGKFKLRAGDIRGGKTALSRSQRETVNAVLRYYGRRSSHWLSILTHRERPWREARGNLAPGERGDAEITHAAMGGYYGGL